MKEFDARLCRNVHSAILRGRGRTESLIKSRHALG